jgi:hypothetical protein
VGPGGEAVDNLLEHAGSAILQSCNRLSQSI